MILTEDERTLAELCVPIIEHLVDHSETYQVSEATLIDASVALSFFIDPDNLHYVVSVWTQTCETRRSQGIAAFQVENGPFVNLPVRSSPSDFESLTSLPIEMLKYSLVTLQRVVGLPFELPEQSQRFLEAFMFRILQLAYSFTDSATELAMILLFCIQATSTPGQLSFVLGATLMVIPRFGRVFWYFEGSDRNITVETVVNVLEALYDKEFPRFSPYEDFARCLLFLIFPDKLYITEPNRRQLAVLYHAAVTCYNPLRSDKLLKRMIAYLTILDADPSAIVWYENCNALEILRCRGDEIN